jgi:hypothetical protein
MRCRLRSIFALLMAFALLSPQQICACFAPRSARAASEVTVAMAIPAAGHACCQCPTASAVRPTPNLRPTCESCYRSSIVRDVAPAPQRDVTPSGYHGAIVPLAVTAPVSLAQASFSHPVDGHPPSPPCDLFHSHCLLTI